MPQEVDNLYLLKRRLPRELDGVLISKPENIDYLIGSSLQEGFLLLGKNFATFLTDFCNFEEAKNQVKVEVVLETSPPSKLGKIIKKRGLKKVGFEARHLSYYSLTQLQKFCREVKFIPLPNIVEKLRQVKSEEEILKLRKAAQIASLGFEEILKFIRPGIREIEVAKRLENFLYKKGAEGIPFPTIVASGKRSAYPHARLSSEVLKPGNLVVLDWGVTFQGYNADITRTVVLGKASHLQRRIYQAVYRAQDKALKSITCGKTCAEIYNIAYKELEKVNLAKYFGHGLGHGVGKEVHELPYLGRRNKTRLKKGMVITVEPGVYIPDSGGVRIEDMVVVMDKGYEILSFAPRKLIEI